MIMALGASGMFDVEAVVLVTEDNVELVVADATWFTSRVLPFVCSRPPEFGMMVFPCVNVCEPIVKILGAEVVVGAVASVVTAAKRVGVALVLVHPVRRLIVATGPAVSELELATAFTAALL